MVSEDWRHFTVAEWKNAVARRSALEGVQAALSIVKELNPELNAFTVLLENEALARAVQLDALPDSERGALHGVPVVIKDENDVEGTVTSFGTACNHQSKTADSLTVARLKEAGAVVLGKTTMPAFGAFPFTESEAFGVTCNPLDAEKTPGGSSGGSAVAVASGLVPLALGGDGGGSIRIPSAHCGLVGFKPARGCVSAAPYEHLWHDLGTAGSLARSVADAELMYRVIAGLSIDSLAVEKTPGPLRIALKLRADSPVARLDSEHRRALWQVAQGLRSLGHQVELVTARTPDPTLPFVVQFLAGLRDEINALDNPNQVEKLHRHTRLLARWVTPSVLNFAKETGERISQKLETTYFEDYDLVLTATTATRPGKAGQLKRGGFFKQMLVSVPSVAYTLLWNVSGHPALALPVGLASDGLPLSVQLVASRRPEEEKMLFALAHQLETHLHHGK